MSNVKSKFSLSFVMLLVLIMTLGSVALAAEYIYIPVNLTVKDSSGATLKNGADLGTVKAGDKITATAYCNNELALLWSQNTNFMADKGYKFNDKGMALLSYMFDSTDKTKYTQSSDPTQVEIKIPNFAAGSEHYLVINAVAACDGLPEGEKEYQATSGTFAVKFKMASETVVEPEKPETKVAVALTRDTDTTVKMNATITNSTFTKFVYSWDGEPEKTLTTNPATVTVPTTVGTHKLTVKAYAADGKTGIATYTFTVNPVVPEDDELIIDSWMKEDKSMQELAVSLRNDSEEYDKGNKNFYALNEEVVYYVDYKNGGDDITREVKLVLELPLDFKVIDAFGGKVDSKERTITWTFPNGLEEDQSGTKVVKLAYTGFEKSSKKYEIVYPVADIYERNKVVDSSAVINYIFKNEDTEITDEHYPFMIGDAGADTFRPDDIITRAEGALVLTRIFGIDTTGTTVEPVFTDLGETYIEAQKAIVAATKLGLINGYGDGTYRPNEKMTRAQFMKIIASYIEVNAENEDIRGLEVKEDSNITIYKDPTKKYMTGSTSVDEHWGINYVTLLIRLNMTPVSSSNKNLELDKGITRAEVAQLVNFYLLRAPADVDSTTKTQFSDVSKRHDLFADIVEATRPAHTYTITMEGYEVEAEIED